MVHELIEARDERRLLRLQRQLAACKLLIIDLCAAASYVESGSPTQAEPGFDGQPLHIMLRQRHQSRFSQSTILTAAGVN